jgi:hypothetical protein
MKKFLLLIATLVATPACHKTNTHRRTLNLKETTQPLASDRKEETPSVTVWIHGTRALKPLDEFAHAAPKGLHPVGSLTDIHRIKQLAKTISTADTVKFPFEHFYAFGWSGDLSFTARHEEATRLHEDLERLVAEYRKKYGHAPFIRLITHSHGGNVALNLATIPHPNKDWFINETILLACPVQHKTEHLIASPLFGKVYSFYSTLDSLQVADPQGLYKKERRPGDNRVFSQRRFPNHEKLIQVKLRINNHGVMHLGFILDSFIKHLPTVLNHLDAWEQEEPHTSDEVRQLNLLI